MVSTSPAHLAKISCLAVPKQIAQGHFSPRWRTIMQDTLSTLPPAPRPLELVTALKQTNIKTFLSTHDATVSPPRRGSAPTTTTTPNPIRIVIQPTRGSESGRPLPKRTRHEPATNSKPIHPPRGIPSQREQASIVRIISKCVPAGGRPTRFEKFVVQWGPISCRHGVAMAHQEQGCIIESLTVLETFDDSLPLEDNEIDPPCVRCKEGGGDFDDPDLIQCERCLQWIHSYCLPSPMPTDTLFTIAGWTCPSCAPRLSTNRAPTNYARFSTRDRHLGVYGGFKTESLFVPVFCNVDPWADIMRYVLILEIRGSESSSSLAD